MKKTGVFGIFVIIMAFCAISVAATTIVGGKITWEDKTTPVDGADVNITCYRNGVPTSKYAVSEDDGAYGVEFYIKECKDGDTVEVSAQKGSSSGSNTGIVHDLDLSVNVAVVNVSIPEFTTITSAIALTGAAVGYLTIRKRRDSK